MGPIVSHVFGVIHLTLAPRKTLTPPPAVLKHICVKGKLFGFTTNLFYKMTLQAACGKQCQAEK